MSEYNRIYVSEETDVNKTIGSHECFICHNWCFLQINLRFQKKVYDGCQDLMQKAMTVNDVAIVSDVVKEMIRELIFVYEQR